MTVLKTSGKLRRQKGRFFSARNEAETQTGAKTMLPLPHLLNIGPVTALAFIPILGSKWNTDPQREPRPHHLARRMKGNLENTIPLCEKKKLEELQLPVQECVKKDCHLPGALNRREMFSREKSKPQAVYHMHVKTLNLHY